MSDEELGDCFEANAKMFLQGYKEGVAKFRRNDAFLCHGFVRGAIGSPVEGMIFIHCWIEIGDRLLDVSNGSVLMGSKLPLYASGQILQETIVRYTFKEVCDNILKHKHWGAWAEQHQKKDYKEGARA